MYLKKVLFICLGNICRSPSAEGVMKHLLKKNGMDEMIDVDSAGTIGYHTGSHADARMRTHAIKRGYDLTSIARKFNPDRDFEYFDYIIAMDNENFHDITALDVDNYYRSKIYRMVDFSKNKLASEVPDPYYEGPQGFELVLDIIEDACEGLLNKIKNDINKAK